MPFPFSKKITAREFITQSCIKTTNDFILMLINVCHDQQLGYYLVERINST